MLAYGSQSMENQQLISMKLGSLQQFPIHIGADPLPVYRFKQALLTITIKIEVQVEVRAAKRTCSGPAATAARAAPMVIRTSPNLLRR